jgi:hypothetical protein
MGNGNNIGFREEGFGGMDWIQLTQGPTKFLNQLNNC